MKHLKNSFLLILFLCTSTYTFAQKSQESESLQKFVNYLENSLTNSVVNDKTKKEFNEKTWMFWSKYKLDYNINPEKYNKAISLFYQNKALFKENVSRNINRYTSAIKEFHHFESRNTLTKEPILFIGSSSIAGWETAIAFPKLPIINRGLGGISLPEIIHYYDDIIKIHTPSTLVVYCDIDIENGKSPNQAIDAFKTLANKVRADFPKIQILLMAMKPTLIDDFLGKDIRKNKIITNKRLSAYCKKEKNTNFIDITKPMIKANGSLRADIFISDGMHLNDLGYSLWNPIIRKEILGKK